MPLFVSHSHFNWSPSTAGVFIAVILWRVSVGERSAARTELAGAGSVDAWVRGVPGQHKEYGGRSPALNRFA